MFEIIDALDGSVGTDLQIFSENLLDILHSPKGFRRKYPKRAPELCS